MKAGPARTLTALLVASIVASAPAIALAQTLDLAAGASTINTGALDSRVALADLRLFDPGHIISDAVFFDARSMTAQQIQDFLTTQGARCTSAGDAWCLKDYREDAIAKPADQFCSALSAQAGESAASIIARVAAACGINPQVILVTLQKEQSLVSKRTPSTYAATYFKAMGFRCPDFQSCDPAYAGFFRQVYAAAHRFQEYVQQPHRFNYRAERSYPIAYHPTPSCGSAPVYITNAATAALYNYTPFQPNAAIVSGKADACSATGNLNFYRFFSDWFGTPARSAPLGTIDSVTSQPSGPATATLTVTGWALDKDTFNSIDVHIYVNGVGYAQLANGYRPDVDAAFRRGANKGYTLTVPVPAGRTQVCAYGIEPESGPNALLACRTIEVTGQVNRDPAGRLDEVSVTGSQISVRGWALDPDSGAAPIAVHVYVAGRPVVLTANEPRADVGAAFGLGDQHGFTASIPAGPGTHQVCAYAINTPAGNNPTLGCRTVTVAAQNTDPIGRLDEVQTAPGQISVWGWALDADAPGAAIGVHVYVDDRAVVLEAAGPRPDVDAAFGLGAAHGFASTLAAPAGRHQVCAYAINTPAGNNPNLGCRTVTVP